MPPADHFYDLRKLHAIFAVSAAALLGVTVWMLAADYRREWKAYQRTYQDEVERRVTEERLRREEASGGKGADRLRRTLESQGPSWGRWVARLPLVEAFGRSLSVRQIWLPELTVDYHFQHVARVDRCTTCHLAMDGTVADEASRQVHAELPHPLAQHPRPELYVSEDSPHPASKFGCTVCHEGQGSATEFRFASHTPGDSGRRASWETKYGWFRDHDWASPMRDTRLVEASCLRCHHDPLELEASPRFPNAPAPKLLEGFRLVRQLGCFGCHEIRGLTPAGEHLGPDLRLESAASAKADPRDGASGTYRKVGPSLGSVAAKFDKRFLQAMIARPSAFRSESRMPQLFGLHEHLEGETLEKTQRLEAVEVRAIAEYLLAASQEVSETLDGAASMADQAHIARGSIAFKTHGCLACHKHKDFPQATSTAGPDLTDLGTKLSSPTAVNWLVDWLREPAKYSLRTRMPNTLLEPEQAADIAAFLLASREGRPELPGEVNEADVDELIRSSGIEMAGKATLEAKLRELGRYTIGRRGCVGCHDVPGFDVVEPIGPALSDWGRKQESLLAFEQVAEYLLHKPATTARAPDPAPHKAATGGRVPGPGERPEISNLTSPPSATNGRGFMDGVRDGRREAFLWQKLAEPRSFDFRKADTKPFDQQLRMGRFTLTDSQREAIMTFVPGLVAQPPVQKYVYQPDRRQKALLEGRAVLEQNNCSTCHTLAMERWTFQFDPKTFRSPAETTDYDFLTPTISPAELDASRKLYAHGKGRAEAVGMPRLDAGGQPVVVEGEEEDAQGEPLPMASFVLWEPAAINGHVWRVGGQELLMYHRDVLERRPAWGGEFARLLFPLALAQAKSSGSTAGEQEAWGWVPPPLVHEGAMVRPQWLFEYLLDPQVIRPAAVLRMPKFNLSPQEAGKLVDYFAAAANADWPYETDHRRRPSWATRGEPPPERLDKAARLIADRTTFCAKCHVIGRFRPSGETRTILAPDLERVGERIRPDYVRRWLANPRNVLPYTAMPVNFPSTGPAMGQETLPGSSVEQLDAVMELLLNYDERLKRARAGE